MGIFSWLTHAQRDEEETGVAAMRPVEFEKHEEVFHGLNMRLAIEAHMQWKDRLLKVIDQSSGESLDVGTVAADDRCILGQWLHTEGRQRFGNLPEYRELLKTHADFHLAAGEILCDAHDGNREAASCKLKTAFRQKSDRVQLMLVRLYARGQQ